MVWRTALLACLGALLWLGPQFLASARPTQATLTAADYRRHCLLCHKAAPPEGIAPEIVAGLGAGHGPSAAELMPNTICWRRCEKCWPQTPAKKR